MTGSYTTVLLIAGAAYLVALAVVQILTPRLEPARVRLTSRRLATSNQQPAASGLSD